MTLTGHTNTTLTLRNVTTSSDVDSRRAKLDGTEPQVLIRGQSQPAIVTLDLSVPPPLNLQVATTSDAGLTLSWNALMGRAYRVQSDVRSIQPASRRGHRNGVGSERGQPCPHDTDWGLQLADKAVRAPS